MEESPAKKKTASNKWAERLRGRSRMAVAVIGAVFLAGFLGVARPLSQRIDGANDRLAKAGTRAQLAEEVSSLRHQASLYKTKLARGVDPNDWTNYFLSGIRKERVKLVRMEPKDVLTLGPCKVLTWQMEMEGNLESLARVIAWMEKGDRLVRIDRLVLESPHGGTIEAAMTVRGLALEIPADQLKAERERSEKEKAKATQIKAQKEKAPSWLEEQPMALPEGVKLPGGIKIPDVVRNALEEANQKNKTGEEAAR